MNSKEIGDNNTDKQKTISSLPKAVAAVLLTIQASANFLVIPASISAATASGSTIEKTTEGIKVPIDIIEWIVSIPENIQTVEDLEEFLEDKETEGITEELQNLWDKTVLGTKIGTDITGQALGYAMDQLERMKQGLDNFEEMPAQTIVSIIFVLLFYLTIGFGAKAIRLGDRDTIPDKWRKKHFRRFNNISYEEAIYRYMRELGIGEQGAIDMLDGLINELRKRTPDSEIE